MQWLNNGDNERSDMKQFICDYADKCHLLPCPHRIKHPANVDCVPDECIQVGCTVKCVPCATVVDSKGKKRKG
jgi:hypothetical protein